MGRILNIHEVDQFSLDEYQRPEAGDKDVVVKIKACGICGSDLTYIKHGGIHRKPGGVTPLGHEAAGEVLYVGKDVAGVSSSIR
jgi:(R,R)-butanediol dehydrogenase / meso-butanediol dehydrogenase / diacetyl reductase